MATAIAEQFALRKKAAELRIAGELQYESCRRSLLYYLENFCWTLDEHERDGAEKPLFHGKRWIDPSTLLPLRELDGSEDDYLRYTAAVWEQVPLLAIPKSRQLRLSHLMVACHRWLAQFHPGQRIAIQSKQAGDADALLERCKAALDLERKRYPWLPWPDIKRVTERIVFPNGSIMMAIAQGADKVRSYTFSAIMSDEMGFQEEAEAAYTAAIPTIEGGGKYTAISSANPGFFQKIVFDKTDVS